MVRDARLFLENEGDALVTQGGKGLKFYFQNGAL